MLEFMDTQDQLADKIGDCEARIAELEATLASADVDIPAGLATLDGQKIALEALRQAAIPTLPDDISDRYLSFRIRNRRAVALIIGGACNACMRVLMQQQHIDLQRGRMTACRNCKRWLAPESFEDAEDA
jgi:predicted  nucleic acid-binding Zn-ribbon protein